MTLSGGQVTTIDNEITNDPLALGYAGKTNAQIAALMNAAGSASFQSWLPSETPVMVRGDEILEVISQIDGMVDRNNAYGAGLAECLRWFRDSDDLWAICGAACFNGAALVNMAGNDHRGMIDYMAGVEVEIGSPPVTYTLISEEAMTAALRLGEVLLSRSRELIGRSITEAEVAQALA